VRRERTQRTAVSADSAPSAHRVDVRQTRRRQTPRCLGRHRRPADPLSAIDGTTRIHVSGKSEDRDLSKGLVDIRQRDVPSGSRSKRDPAMRPRLLDPARGPFSPEPEKLRATTPGLYRGLRRNSSASRVPCAISKIKERLRAAGEERVCSKHNRRFIFGCQGSDPPTGSWASCRISVSRSRFESPSCAIAPARSYGASTLARRPDRKGRSRRVPFFF